MSREARLVVPGYAHHIVQRGNDRQQVFFCDDDYAAYIGLLEKYAPRAEVCLEAYCLMPNHIHLSARPAHREGLARMMQLVSKLYAEHLNARRRASGRVWSSRFFSSVMDEGYALAARHYIHENPVRARLVREATEWRWSSARAYRLGLPDRLVGARDGDIEVPATLHEISMLRRNTGLGTPTGAHGFKECVHLLGAQ